MPVFAEDHLERIGDRLGSFSIPGETVLHGCGSFAGASPGAVSDEFEIGHRSGDVVGMDLSLGPVQDDLRIAEQDLVLSAKYGRGAIGAGESRVAPFFTIVITGAGCAVSTIPGVVYATASIGYRIGIGGRVYVVDTGSVELTCSNDS